MNPIALSRLLGWFSLGLGALEILAPSALARRLGVPGGWRLVRLFGVREVVAGVTVLGQPGSPLGPWARVAGDALDLAVLGAALSPGNDRRRAAAVATAMVLGVTLLDVLCASELSDGQARAGG